MNKERTIREKYSDLEIGKEYHVYFFNSEDGVMGEFVSKLKEIKFDEAYREDLEEEPEIYDDYIRAEFENGVEIDLIEEPTIHHRTIGSSITEIWCR